MGPFITLEGGEGAGKSTQARLLASHLRGLGQEVLETREPGGTPGAEALRSLLLSPPGKWPDEAEILLHFAARADHVAHAILPARARGATVVCDRFFDSTMAYQGVAAGGDQALIAALSARVPAQPDLTLILEVPAEIRHARVAARRGEADRYEAESEAFHLRVAAGFRAIADAAPGRCVRIDASGTVDAVQRAIRDAVARRGLARDPGTP